MSTSYTHFWKAHWDKGLVLGLLMLFIFFFSWRATMRHAMLQSMAYDLGVYDQAIWNTSQGRPFEFSVWRGYKDWFVEPGRTLGEHVELILAFIAPLYWLWSDVRVLLILQALVVGVGALGLWRLTHFISAKGTPSAIITRWTAFIVVLAYLLNPAIQSLTLDDFHSVALAAGMLPWAIYFMIARRYRALVILSMFLMLTKEDMPMLVAGIGLYVLVLQGIRDGDKKALGVGLLLMIAAILWAFIAFFVIIPSYSVFHSSPFFWRFQELAGVDKLTPGNLPKIVVGLGLGVFRKQALTYALGLLWPTGFLALLGFPVLLIAAFPFMLNVTSAFAAQRLLIGHYTATIVPMIYAAAVVGIGYVLRKGSVFLSSSRFGRLLHWGPLLAAGWMLFFTGIAQIDYGFTPLARNFRWPRLTAHHVLAQRFFHRIPPEASVTTQSMLAPHLTHRQQITLFPYDTSGTYFLVDISRNWPNDTPEGHLWLRDQIVHHPDYGIVDAADGIVLLQRNAPRQPMPEAFYSFFYVDDPEIAYPMQVDFGDAIRLLGFDLIEHGNSHPTFRFYFQALRSLDTNYTIPLYVADAMYRVQGAVETPQIPLIWLPTSEWPTDQIIRMDFNALPQWQGLDSPWVLAMGVQEGDDVWAVDRRLLPRIDASSQYPRLLSENTLVYLMRFAKQRKAVVPRPDELLTQLPSSATPASATFDPVARLEGYLLRGNRQPGGELVVTLFWRALQPSATSYTVFTQLLGPDGQLYGQHDSPPGYGTLPTTRWHPHQLIPDEHRFSISPQAPSGDYQLLVGFYDPQTGQRLPLEQSARDFFAIPISLE